MVAQTADRQDVAAEFEAEAEVAEAEAEFPPWVESPAAAAAANGSATVGDEGSITNAVAAGATAAVGLPCFEAQTVILLAAGGILTLTQNQRES